MTRPRHTAILLAATFCLATVLTGCLGGAGTKAGVGRSASLTLTMPAPDTDDPDAAYFAEQVAARTDGRVRIVIDRDTYRGIDPDDELRLVRDLRAGKVTIAYVAARAWERDGIAAFRALQAPLLIGDYALLRRVVTGPIGDGMLHELGAADVVGLGLVPKELRRTLGTRRLISTAELRGARVRVLTSPTSLLVMRALGALPVTHLDAHEVGSALAAGSIDGVETETHAILTNNYTRAARYLAANVPLFAKAETIAIRREVMARLRPADQRALRAAAAATATRADPAVQENSELAQLCERGVRLVRAGPSERTSLRHASASAIATLERDPKTSGAIKAIKALNRSTPAAPSSLPDCPDGENGAPADGARFPEGRFVTPITNAELVAGGADADPRPPKPFTITIRDGRWQTNEHPAYGGHYVVRGDEVTFDIEHPAEGAGQAETLKWSYFRAELEFEIVDVVDAGSRVIYTTHPWRRVGS